MTDWIILRMFGRVALLLSRYERAQLVDTRTVLMALRARRRVA